MSNYNYQNQKKAQEIETLNPKIIDEKLKSGKITGIYCLFGDEEYMIDYYIKKILLPPSLRDTPLASEGGFETDGFDCAVFDADNFDLDQFRDIIASYPIMSEYKIAAVKNAGDIKFKGGGQDELVRILTEHKEDIRDYCCVIFKMKNLSEPKAKNAGRDDTGAAKTKKASGLSLAAFLKENAELFEFKENPPASLIKWLKKIAASENVALSDDDAGYILGRGEKKMYPLKNELDKLICFVQSENIDTITRKDIELLVPEKIEIEAFGLTNAILDKKYGKAMESLEKLRDLKEEPLMILGQIARYFSDLSQINMAIASGITDSSAISKKTGIHEYKVKLTAGSLRRYANPGEFVKKSLDLCRECDVRLKSTSLDNFGLIENLLANIAGL